MLQVQHPADDAVELFGVAGRDPLEFAFLDFDCQGHRVQRLEGWVEGAELVYNTTKRPNVTLLIVLLVMNLLRRHIIRRSDVRERELGFIIKNPRKSKVSQLDVAVQVKEDVAGFQVTVQDFLG